MTTHVVRLNRTGAPSATIELKDDVGADTILPAQFFSLRGPATLKTGEQQLLLALLNDAVCCFCKYADARSRRERRLHDEADLWLMDESEPLMKPGQTPTFSLEYVCEALHLDAGYLRGGLRLWRDRHLHTGLTA